MKRSLFTQPFRQTVLAVPACALMLGAAHAGTTVGLNFQAWYYNSNANPQTIGYGNGYQTTGFPVTAKAFGVATANWWNADPMNCQAAISGDATFGGVNTTFAGSLTALVNAPNAWQSGIGAQVAGWNPETVAPGNDEVTWGYLDDGNATGGHPTVAVSGLAAQFPNGYVVQTIAANSGVKTFNNVDITDGTTTNELVYSTYFVPDAVDPEYDGTFGISAPSGAFTADTIDINPEPKTSGNRSTLCGFILTDQPVVSLDPADTTVNQGGTLSLTATVIGVGTLAYQWQHAGTNFPGATAVPFSKTATAADAGSWVLICTNLYGTAISDAAAVTVNQAPLIVTDLATATNLVYAGTPVALSVVAGGANPLSYQWYQNGLAIVGATNAGLTVTNLAAGLFGYSVVVSNQYSPPLALSSTNHLKVVATPDAYTALVAADGPNSYWPLGETAGGTAFDYSGLGHNGAISNNMTLGAAGPAAPAFPGFNAATKAYQFDGATAFVACGTAASLNGPTDFTVEAWINTSSAATQVIAQQRDNEGYIGEYQFSVNSSGDLEFYIFNGSYQADIVTATSVADGAWHHVVAVRSGANEYIYVDGAMAASGSGTIASLTGTIQTYIGSDQRGVVSYFNGSMAAVAIYSQALSSGRIIQHYIVGTGTPFAMSRKPGGMIKDSKPAGTPHPGQGHNVGWTNSVTDAASPPVTRTGVAVFSEAASSQIVTPADPDFNTTNGTVCFWMTAEAPLPGPGSEGAMLVDRRTTNGAVIVLHADGSIFWQGAAGTANAFSGGYLPDGNWHHVALTYGQTTNDTLSLYVDGALAASTPVTNDWSWPAGQEIEIGVSHDSYWQKFDGQMDDFRIYKRILSATEVAQVYASDALVDTNSLAVRYNFDSAIYGESVVWPFGVLQTSPTLGPSAVWTTLTNAISPYGFLPSAPSMFYRASTSP
ncbi:MAG: LamG-like jellyroll fold domain-containing protein [Verrucomicrobiota bacterium]